MKAAIFLLLCTALAARAGIIRLSLVAEKDGPGITRFELGEGESAQVHFVEDNAIITEADIAEAMPSPARADSIDISLSAEGTDKMIAATGIMRPAIDRIAILVDGEILSAPVVQSVPLGKHFVINGLDGENEALKLAARLSGKSEQVIADELAVREKRLRDLPPLPKPVFHTEEEYLQLKAEREKIGLHYMDRVYTEQELPELLKVGMKEAEVIAIFGKPNTIKRKEEGTSELLFETAPEKRPDTPKFHMDSFDADFAEGKLTGWQSRGWSENTRAPKQPQRKPGNLIIKSTPIDMSEEDFDLISFCEKMEISLKPGKKAASPKDIYELLNILWSAAATFENDRTIDSQCDMITWLAPKIPELAELSQKSKGDGIPLNALRKAIEPYIFGQNQLR